MDVADTKVNRDYIKTVYFGMCLTSIHNVKRILRLDGLFDNVSNGTWTGVCILVDNVSKGTWTGVCILVDKCESCSIPMY